MTFAMHTARKRILLTGAPGGIGSAFFRFARDRYSLRLADPVAIPAEALDAGEHEAVSLDVADLASCQRACERIDTVVHLAADANRAAEFYNSLLDKNIKGTYNIFRAAKDQGCRHGNTLAANPITLRGVEL
jgi:uronate dehydrogenase